MLNAFSCFFGRMGSGKKNDPMDFMDEYAEVMNKYAEVEVYNGFKRGYKGLSIAYSWRCQWVVAMSLLNASVGVR